MKLSKSYPFFPMDKKKLNTIYLFLIGLVASFLIILSVFLIALQFILDKELIRGMISKQINNSTNFLVTYEEVETIMFPLPGIQIININVSSSDSQIAKLNKIKIYWNIYALLLKKFELDSISLESGEIFLTRSQDGNFPAFSNIDKEKEKVEQLASESEKTPDGILNLLPNTIYVNELTLHYIDQRWNRKDQINIQSLELKSDSSDRLVHLNTKLLLNDSPLYINSVIQLLDNNWDLKNSNGQLQIKMNLTNLSQYEDILSIFPKANFNQAGISLELDIIKNQNNQISIELQDLSMLGLENKNRRKVQDIHFNSKVYLELDEKKLTVAYFNYELLNKAKLNLDSIVSWKDSLHISSKIHSENSDIDSTLAWISIFSSIDYSKSILFKDLESKTKIKPEFKSRNASKIQNFLSLSNNSLDTTQSKEKPNIAISLNLNKILLGNQYIHKLTGNIQGDEENIKLSNLELLLYDGKVKVNGSYKPKGSGQNLNLTADLKGIDMKKMLARVSSDKLLTGKMYASIQLNSRINGKDSFVNYMNMHSNLVIKNGELLGYANFIRPVAEIGKIVNFNQENSGKSTAFHSIHADITLKNKIVYLNKFDMEGIGINAVGSGIYSSTGKVDMKFTASLPGIAGKAFKIPILYKGFLGKNVAFIDPVWMASVYVGSVLFAGPAGAVIGGLAGSASSDAVHKASDVVSDSYDSAKNFLFGKKK